MTDSSVPELLGAPSYVPAEERFIHIAGGFFSHFDGKTGSLTDPAENPAGSVCIELDELCHESRFVYLTTGTIVVRDGRGHTRRFALKRLDYVRLPGSDLPAYRLTGEGATLVVTDSDHEAPCLSGDLYVQENAGYEHYTVSIQGRSVTEAEIHLWRKVERVTTPKAGDVTAASRPDQEHDEGATAL